MVTIYVLNAKICLTKEPETADRIGGVFQRPKESPSVISKYVLLFPEASRTEQRRPERVLASLASFSIENLHRQLLL
jgi:hypothetical protein